MAENKMTQELKDAFVSGKVNAEKHRDSAIRVEHIIYGLLATENVVREIVKNRTGEGFPDLLQDIDDLNRQISVVSDDVELNKNIPIDVDTKDTVVEARRLSTEDPNLITHENFFLATLAKDIQLVTILREYAINSAYFKRQLNKLNVTTIGDEEPKSNKMGDTKKPNSKTPILDNFGRDLTALALQDKLDPVIGREAEVERVAQILTRRKKNNPVLIGDPGVGKTAIAEGLAIRIAKKECPLSLQNRRIIALEMTNLVAGTKFRGEFEQRMKSLIEELRDHKEIVLFIDELHTMVGAGNGSGTLDAANIFKPALSRGEIQCIGATTLDEFREHIEKDGALERRFQKVSVNPTSLDETTEILLAIKDKYEEFHNVSYTDESIHEIVRLADRYITTREFPDKAIDIMDEAGSRTQIAQKKPEELKQLEKELIAVKKRKMDVVKAQRFEEAADILKTEQNIDEELTAKTKAWKDSITNERITVTDSMIAEVVSLMTGIPITKVSQNEAKKLLRLESDLHGSVIGQNEAIKTVASAIKRNRVGISRKNRPIGTFLFVGPTGVGKTELAKQLAKKVFGSEDAMTRIDMSEYQEAHSVSRLIGAPPGYVGYNEGGQLTEKVRNKPYQVVLLDEIEKAHPKVFDTFLQILDEGHVTDGLGRTINFKNAIVIMTSNVGVRASITYANGIGFGIGSASETTRQRDIITKEMKKWFRPEFLNRIDDIIFFNNLSEADILEIVELQFNELIKRMSDSNYTVSFGEGVNNYIQKNGYDKDLGAREMQRAVQKLIEDPISDALLLAGMPESGQIIVKMNESQDKVIVDVA